jgi:hypothetical protein
MAINSDIKRRSELFLCGVLAATMPDVKFFPSKGGSDTEDESVLEPPYGVFAAGDAERMMAGEDTWLIPITALYVTHMDDTDVVTHSANFRRIYDALKSVEHGVKPDQGIVVHGMDIHGTDEARDEDERSHADTIALVLAVSG